MFCKKVNQALNLICKLSKIYKKVINEHKNVLIHINNRNCIKNTVYANKMFLKLFFKKFLMGLEPWTSS